MSILIISLPRTGSSELGNKLSEKNNLKYIYEPFDRNKNLTEIEIDKDILIKTVVFRSPIFIDETNRILWLINLSKEFDEVILLSRKNLIECAESWAYLVYNKKVRNFRDNRPYLWKKTPNYDDALEFIKKCHYELEYISSQLNIPITYYEDLYDPNDKRKLRKGNLIDYKKKII